MAAGIAALRLGARAEVASAGIGALGGPVAEDAVLVMRIIYKTDISGHVAVNVTDVNIASFDYVVAMDLSIYTFLKGLRVIPEERLFGWDIEDPLGLGYDAFKRAALRIEHRLSQFLTEIGLDV
jgi:protein-tyrosine-phosphatase